MANRSFPCSCIFSMPKDTSNQQSKLTSFFRRDAQRGEAFETKLKPYKAKPPTKTKLGDDERKVPSADIQYVPFGVGTPEGNEMLEFLLVFDRCVICCQ